MDPTIAALIVTWRLQACHANHDCAAILRDCARELEAASSSSIPTTTPEIQALVAHRLREFAIRIFDIAITYRDGQHHKQPMGAVYNLHRSQLIDPILAEVMPTLTATGSPAQGEKQHTFIGEQCVECGLPMMLSGGKVVDGVCRGKSAPSPEDSPEQGEIAGNTSPRGFFLAVIGLQDRLYRALEAPTLQLYSELVPISRRLTELVCWYGEHAESAAWARQSVAPHQRGRTSTNASD